MNNASSSSAAGSDAVHHDGGEYSSRSDVTVAGHSGQDLMRSSGGGRNERGMVSAEWAVGLIAAISIAGVLIGVLTSPAVREALLTVVLRIINFISGISIPG